MLYFTWTKSLPDGPKQDLRDSCRHFPRYTDGLCTREISSSCFGFISTREAHMRECMLVQNNTTRKHVIMNYHFLGKNEHFHFPPINSIFSTFGLLLSQISGPVKHIQIPYISMKLKYCDFNHSLTITLIIVTRRLNTIFDLGREKKYLTTKRNSPKEWVGATIKFKRKSSNEVRKIKYSSVPLADNQ